MTGMRWDKDLTMRKDGICGRQVWIVWVSCCSMALGILACQGPLRNAGSILPNETDETGFVDLFSAKALKDWRQCGPGKFTIPAGVAWSTGGMGLWWYAGRQYGDFVLRGEFMQEDPIADSGVFVRFPDPGQDPWIAVNQGHEMEIGDPEPKDPTWRTGSIYPFCASTKANTGPLGQWNRYEIACVGQRYRVRINGEIVLDWTDPQQRTIRGYIGLQNYNDSKTVRHRKLRIKALDY